MQRDPPGVAGVENVGRRRPYRIEEVVANDNSRAGDETRPASQELRTGQHDHARANRPDHLHHHAGSSIKLLDAPRRKTPGGRHDHTLDEDEPQPALEEERARRAGRSARRHQARAGSGEEHEHRRAEMRDPPREEEGGTNRRIGHRIRFAAHVEEIAHVIDGHDHDHETTKHVDAGQPIGAANRRAKARALDDGFDRQTGGHAA